MRYMEIQNGIPRHLQIHRLKRYKRFWKMFYSVQRWQNWKYNIHHLRLRIPHQQFEHIDLRDILLYKKLLQHGLKQNYLCYHNLYPYYKTNSKSHQLMNTDCHRKLHNYQQQHHQGSVYAFQQDRVVVQTFHQDNNLLLDILCTCC